MSDANEQPTGTAARRLTFDREAREDRSRLRLLLAPLTMAVAAIALLAIPLTSVGARRASAVRPWPVVRAAPARIGLGVTTGDLARDAWRPFTDADLAQVGQFEHVVRAHAAVVMFYADWRHDQFSRSQLEAIERLGSIPEISWEPWDAENGSADQPAYRLRQIIAGRYDAYIRSWARGLAAFGHEVRLRFSQEMDGRWYPWGEDANGNRPGEFIRAWRHVHHIFALAGASNVQWVWNPVSGAPRDLYPGNREVNRFGVDCLNGGTAAFGDGWRSFAHVCARQVAQLHALGPRVPIDISETASTNVGGSKVDWIQGMFRYLRHHPEVKTVIWFDLDKETDWRVDSSPATGAAFAAGIRAERVG